MQNRLLGHIQRHVDNYKLLVVGSAAAALIGAVAAIVYDNSGPHPWDVFLHDQQQAIQGTRAQAK